MVHGADICGVRIFLYHLCDVFFSNILSRRADTAVRRPETCSCLSAGSGLFCGVVWGTVSDRIGRKYTLAIVYTIQAISFGLFALWSQPAGFLISTILFGLTAWRYSGDHGWQTCGDVLGAKMAPAALGFITLFFGIGQALGPSVAGALADATGSFNPAFLLAAGIAFNGCTRIAFSSGVK